MSGGIGAGWANLEVIDLGTVAQADEGLPRIHRRPRCDLRLVQLGLRLLAYRFNYEQPSASSRAIEPETIPK